MIFGKHLRPFSVLNDIGNFHRVLPLALAKPLTFLHGIFRRRRVGRRRIPLHRAWMR